MGQNLIKLEPTMLALDASTTHVGFVIATESSYIDGGEIAVKGTTDKRLLDIYSYTLAMLEQKPTIETIVVESPVYVARRGKGDAGARTFGTLSELKGVLRLLAIQMDKRFIDVHPWAVKIALTKSRYATKAKMIEEAKRRIGGVKGEHHADALGVWLAGRKKL